MTSKGPSNNYIALIGSNAEKKDEEEVVKIMMENPNAYEYDDMYDTIQANRQDILDQKKHDRSSRYFEKAKFNAERSKIEKDVIREKMAAKQ